MLVIQKYLNAIFKHGRFIFNSIIFFTILAVIISFILPIRYKATAQILPPSDDADMFSIPSIIGSDMSAGGVSSFLRRGGILRSTTQADLIVPILESRTIGEKVIEKCNLMKAFKIKKSIEKALKELGSITVFTITDEGVVQIEVVTKPATLAAQVANAYIEELDRFLRASNMSRGRNTRSFLEKRLPEAEEELRLARDSLTAFLQKHKTVVLDEEAKDAINIYAQLKSQLLTKEIEYSLAYENAAPDNPYLIKLKKEIDESRVHLAKIESGETVNEGFGAGFAISFRKLPLIMMQYAQKLSAVKIKEQIYMLLVQQYEQAKIIETRDTPLITVLDYARVPERKAYPKRMLIVASFFIFSFVFAIFASFLAEYIDNMRTSKPNEYDMWLQLYNKIRGNISNLHIKKIFPHLGSKKIRSK